MFQLKRALSQLTRLQQSRGYSNMATQTDFPASMLEDYVVRNRPRSEEDKRVSKDAQFQIQTISGF